MKHALVIVTAGLALACLTATPLCAQSPVRQDILKILGEIPAPPATPQAAYDQVTVDLAKSPAAISAAKLFAGVEGQFKAAEDAYNAQEPSAAAAVPPGMPQDMARLASDPEFRKKMKSMSKEEKARMAMAMAGSAGGAPAVSPEPPAVQAAFNEWQQVSLDTQAEFERGVKRQQAAVAADEADRKAHDEITEWERAAIKALPQISSGEMSAPDPKAVKEVRLKAADKHLAVAQQRLDAFAKAWPGVRDHVQARYGAFHAKLVACDYAAASTNFSTRKILSDGQMTLMKEIQADAQQVRAEYEAAARWVAHRKAVEAS